MSSISTHLAAIRNQSPQSTLWKEHIRAIVNLLENKKSLSLSKDIPGFHYTDLDNLICALQQNKTITALDFSAPEEHNGDLNKSYVNERNIASLYTYLMNNKTIQKLNLSNNPINDSGFDILELALNDNKTLIKLTIDQKYIKATEAPEESEGFKTSQESKPKEPEVFEVLQKLMTRNLNNSINAIILEIRNLYNPDISAESEETWKQKPLIREQKLEQLIGLLNEKTKLVIHQELPSFSALDIPVLLEALSRNSTISHLDLSCPADDIDFYDQEDTDIPKYINEYNVHLICDFIKDNKTISYLNLSYNSINEEGGIELFRALKSNRRLNCLVLRNTNIGDSCFSGFMQPEFYPNQSIVLDLKIDVSANRLITDEGVESIIGFIKKSKVAFSSNFLRLAETRVSDEMNDELQEACKASKRNQPGTDYGLDIVSTAPSTSAAILLSQPFGNVKMPPSIQEPSSVTEHPFKPSQHQTLGLKCRL